MSAGGPKMDGGAFGVPTGAFTNDGEILVAKLVSTLLGATWLTVVAGWIRVSRAIVLMHIRIIDAVAGLYVRVIQTVGQGSAETLRVGWASGFRAAVQTSQLAAPLIFTLEVIVVSALLITARRRWT